MGEPTNAEILAELRALRAENAREEAAAQAAAREQRRTSLFGNPESRLDRSASAVGSFLTEMGRGALGLGAAAVNGARDYVIAPPLRGAAWLARGTASVLGAGAELADTDNDDAPRRAAARPTATAAAANNQPARTDKPTTDETLGVQALLKREFGFSLPGLNGGEDGIAGRGTLAAALNVARAAGISIDQNMSTREVLLAVASLTPAQKEAAKTTLTAAAAAAPTGVAQTPEGAAPSRAPHQTVAAAPSNSRQT